MQMISILAIPSLFSNVPPLMPAHIFCMPAPAFCMPAHAFNMLQHALLAAQCSPVCQP